MPPLRLDPYVIDTLLPDLVGHDHRPSAFLVYLVLWRLAGQPASLRELAEATGLSKRSVQDAIRRLERRRLAHIERDGPTAIAIARYVVLKPWRRRRTAAP